MKFTPLVENQLLKMTNIAEKRLMQDFKSLSKDTSKTCTAAPYKDDIKKWAAVILGPENTAWEGAVLCLSLEFGTDFPNKPPKARFVNTIYHPNVYGDGSICLDILQDKWSPAYTVQAILVSI